MTIAERAKEFALEEANGNDLHIIKFAYYHGAVDQQNIDIEKACEWLKANTHSFRSDEFLEDFIKAMVRE